jgi:hypothetical protein
MLNSELLRWPDMRVNEDLVLDCYKWLHPACVTPPMLLDSDGPLKDVSMDECAGYGNVRCRWCGFR